MAYLTLVFISVSPFAVRISIKMSGPTIPPFTNSGTTCFIYSISLIISVEIDKCISKSVRVKYSGKAVNNFYYLPNTKTPVSPSFHTFLAQSNESIKISLVTKSI
jgi:hypothetical protein